MDTQQQQTHYDKYSNTEGVDTKQFIHLQHHWKAVYVCFTLCLGYVYNGYSITMISATSLSLIRSKYSADLSTVVSISLLNGMVPIGAMVGVLLIPLFNKITNKKYIHFVYFAITIAGCSFSIIPNLTTILIGRFIVGIPSATYTSTASAYIKQLFSLQYRKPCGACYSAARIFGILLCYSVGYIFQDDVKHYFIFFGPAFIALVQLFLLYFVPLSPIELINNKQYQMAERSINVFYFTLDVQRRLRQIIQQQNQKSRVSMSYEGKKLQSYNFFSAFNLAISRHFCGVTYVVVYSRSIVQQTGLSFSAYAPFIINGVQFISGLAGIYLIRRFKRKYLLIYSTFFMCVFNLLTGCADIEEEGVLVLISMTLFMIPCGAGFQPITWYYGNELVGPDRGRVCTFINWFASALVIFIPPYVTAATPDNKAYPIFFFFAAYLVFSFYTYSFVLQEVQHFREMPMMIELSKKIHSKKLELLG